MWQRFKKHRACGRPIFTVWINDSWKNLFSLASVIKVQLQLDKWWTEFQLVCWIFGTQHDACSLTSVSVWLPLQVMFIAPVLRGRLSRQMRASKNNGIKRGPHLAGHCLIHSCSVVSGYWRSYVTTQLAVALLPCLTSPHFAVVPPLARLLGRYPYPRENRMHALISLLLLSQVPFNLIFVIELIHPSFSSVYNALIIQKGVLYTC